MKVLVLLASGFEEIETSTIVDVLRRAECDVTLAGISEGALTGANGITFVPDALLGDIEADSFDMVVLPGGMPGVDNLSHSEEVIRILAAFQAAGKWVSAICAAAVALDKAGLLEGKKFTCYPGFEQGIQAGEHQLDRVVVDGKLITSRAPGTALEFALALVEVLCGSEKKANLIEGMLINV